MTSNSQNTDQPQDLALSNQKYRKEGFAELKQRLRTLMDMLAEVLGEETDLAESIPWREKQIINRPQGTAEIASMAQLQAICFEDALNATRALIRFFVENPTCIH